MRLFLGLPTAGSPTSHFLESLTKLEPPPNCAAIERAIARGNYVPAERELLAREALEGGFDVLVMIDDDIVMPADALVRLCAVLEGDPSVGVAGALYYSRDGLRPMAVSRWSSQDTTSATVPAFAHEPVEVGGVGFGCVAIRLGALAKLARPYFGAQIFIERALRQARVCNEDYLFCERLRRLEQRVVLHAGVRCGHVERSTQTIVPARWEDEERTRLERMVVQDPAGTYRLVPYEPAAARAGELHERAFLDYITVS